MRMKHTKGGKKDMDMERVIQEAFDNGYLRGYEKGKADRPQGEWLPFEFGDERWHKCSCCGTADKYIEYVPRPNGTVGKLVSIRNFCPHCGARMKGADDGI